MPPKDVAGTGEGYAAGVKAEVAIARTRADVAHRQAELEERGLITHPRGDVSARVAATGLFVMAPAGSHLDKVSPERMVVCDLDGRPVPEVLGSDRLPSPDVAVHAQIYRELPRVQAVVHTDSPYALAWAARSAELPCLTVTAAEEFGGPVPVTAVALAEPGALAAAVVAALAVRPVALVCAVGVFAVGESVREAVRAAESVEAVARHAHLVAQGGTLDGLSLDEAAVAALHERARRHATSTPDAFAPGRGLSHN